MEPLVAEEEAKKPIRLVLMVIGNKTPRRDSENMPPTEVDMGSRLSMGGHGMVIGQVVSDGLLSFLAPCMEALRASLLRDDS